MPSTRPATYVEWREVYQSTVYSLGHAAYSLERMRRKRGPDDFMNFLIRNYWQDMHRLQRLEKRMSVEHEAMDETLCAEIVRLAELTDGD